MSAKPATSAVSGSTVGWSTRTALFALSAVAGAVHLAVTPEHYTEWWGYGVFFLVVALAQLAYGLLWLSDRATRRRLLPAGGVVLNLGLLALYVLTRTAGIPLFGPHAGDVEPVGTLDLISKTVETATTVLLLWVLREAGQRPAD